MKKYFKSFFAAAALMFAASSCSQEEMIGNETSGNEVEVAFNLEMEGQTASRAIGDGTTAEYLYFGAYLDNNNDYQYIETLKPRNLPTDGTPIKFVDKEAKVELRLVKGQTYRFFFWAQSTADEQFYKIDFTNHKVSVQLNEGNTASANNEKRDAFYFMTEPITITGPFNKPITLKRPFAQVNVGVSIGNLADAKKAGIDITQSSFTFTNVATKLDVFDGKTSEPKNITYHNTNIPESYKEDEIGDLEQVDKVDYEYIAMNYILPYEEEDSETALTDATFAVYSGTNTNPLKINEWEVPNLTIQRNWRTNIITSLTEDGEFNIVIDPIFAGDHNIPDTDEESLLFAAENGGTVTLTENVTLTEPLNITAGMVLDLNGYTLTGSLNVNEDVQLTVSGGSIVNTDPDVSGIISNGDLTLNDVEIESARHALRIESGTAIINGGIYKVEPAEGTNMTMYAINVGDDNTVANVTVKGGTFIGPKDTQADSGAAVGVKNGSTVTIEGGNFSGGKNNTLSGEGKLIVKGGAFDQDPSAYVTEGNKVIQNGGMWYVVANDATVAGTADELSSALNAGNNVIVLTGDQEIKMPSSSTTGSIKIVGDGETTIDVTKGAYLDSAEEVIFENLIIKTSTGYVVGEDGKQGSDYAALYSPNATYKDCTFVGPMRVGRDGAKFINCTFTELCNDYIWTYGNDCEFTDCTFNTDGKAILIYSDGGSEVSQVSVKNCKFNATQGAKAGAIANQNCAAIEIHNYGNGVNLTTSGNTFDANFSGEWRIKQYETGKQKVFVNNTEYTTIALDGKTMTIDGNKNVTVQE